MRHLVRGVGVAVGTWLLVSAGLGGAAAQTRVNVSVNAGRTTGTLPDTAYGVNAGVGDDALGDNALTPLLTQAGVGVLRFPGGSTADIYHWRTHTITPGSSPTLVNPKNTFASFLETARSLRVTPLVTVNYGTNAAGTGGGDPQEAAAWVRYANVTKGDGVRYWEVGDEVYGGGAYGSTWDRDLHADHSPAEYGRNALLFIRAMKAADPTIKVGVSLVAPGTWPGGVKPDWNSGVLSVCGGSIDFVSVHWCPETPGHESDAALLAAPGQIPAAAARLRALIAQYCGANAPNIPIFVTKTAPVAYDPGPQSIGPVSALFLPDDYLTWLENGAANVDWAALHSGPTVTKAPAAGYGDLGLFSSGKSPEPAVDTAYPAYFGLEMLGGLGRPGDRFVAVTSSPSSLLAVHAVRRADDSLALLLINKDPSRSLTARVTVAGYKMGKEAAVYTYGPKSPAITPSTAKAAATFTRAVPSYSLVVVVLTPPTPAAPKPRRNQTRPRTQPGVRIYRPAGPRLRRGRNGLIYVMP